MKKTWINFLGFNTGKYGIGQLKALLCVFIFTAASLPANAQHPKWINYSYRNLKYPDSRYFTGFVSRYYNKKSNEIPASNELTNEARVRLAENIKINIKSEITNKFQNVNGTSVEDFKKVSTSYTQIALTGIETEFYFDQKKNEAFAFAWIEITKVSEYYENLLSRLITEMEIKVASAKTLVNDKDVVAANDISNELTKGLRNIENGQSILIACGIVDNATLKVADVQDLKTRIAEVTKSIKKIKGLDLQALVSNITLDLSKQGLNPEIPVRIGAISYRDSGMSSQLSSRIGNLMQHSLLKFGFSVMKDYDFNINQSTKYITLSGTYWDDQEGNIHVIVNALDGDQEFQSLIASAEAWTTSTILDQQKIKYDPSNYFEAQQKSDILNGNQIKDGGIHVELWTNKGMEGPIFIEGDKLSIYIKVDRPGYLRLLNYWADGTKLLLADNYYISPEQVNRVFELPFEWVTACPCGVEFLQAVVQTARFEPLKVKPMNEFQIIDEEFSEVVQKSRSFRGFLNSKEAYMGERRITLTTLN